MQGESSMTDESVKKIEVVIPTPLTQLSLTNYRHWAMRMEVHLDAQGLWETVAETETHRQKRQVSLICNVSHHSRIFRRPVRHQEVSKSKLGDYSIIPCGNRSSRPIKNTRSQNGV